MEPTPCRSGYTLNILIFIITNIVEKISLVESGEPARLSHARLKWTMNCNKFTPYRPMAVYSGLPLLSGIN
jgi:hypothetical protein